MINCMNDGVDLKRLGVLVEVLVVRRSINEENELCRMVRALPGEKKLELVEKFGDSNVRLAASIASRVHLPIKQQLILISHVVSSGRSNAIKQFTVGFFVFRLSAKAVLRTLLRLKDKYPESVGLMAYYYMGSVKYISSRDKESFSELVREMGRDNRE